MVLGQPRQPPGPATTCKAWVRDSEIPWEERHPASWCLPLPRRRLSGTASALITPPTQWRGEPTGNTAMSTARPCAVLIARSSAPFFPAPTPRGYKLNWEKVQRKRFIIQVAITIQKKPRKQPKTSKQQKTRPASEAPIKKCVRGKLPPAKNWQHLARCEQPNQCLQVPCDVRSFLHKQ